MQGTTETVCTMVSIDRRILEPIGGGPSQILPDPVLDKTISIIKMDTCVGPSSYFDDDIGMVFTQDSDLNTHYF